MSSYDATALASPATIPQP